MRTHRTGAILVATVFSAPSSAMSFTIFLVQYPLCRQQASLEIGSIPDAWRTYSLHSFAPVTARMTLHPGLQRARYRPRLPVSDHIPQQQHCPKLSYTMFNLWLSRGGYGKWR
jgi:hypothetical protein